LSTYVVSNCSTWVQKGLSADDFGSEDACLLV